jgi:4-hydroxybenzoate polyprenyltransferase
MKRYTYYPQVVLGAAFSWGMPMAFTAETGELPAAAWLLYIANLLWTVGYDTYYAMTDRDDDLKIGVKSTAILFGEADRVIILTLQGLSLGCLLLAGRSSSWGLVPPGVAGGGGLFRLGVLVHPRRTGCAASRRFCTTTGPGWRFLSGSCWITRCVEAG